MTESDSGGKMVVIRTFNFEFEALVAQASLEGAGFETLILSDGTSGVHPHLNFARGIQLAVRESEASAAIELLDAPVEAGSEDESFEESEEVER